MSGGVIGDGLRVLLGPTTEFHKGVHGSLLDHPPPGVQYHRMPQQEVLFFSPLKSVASTNFNPLRHPAFSETVSFGDAAANVDLAHTSRLPVSDPDLAFVADADCLLFTLQCGAAFAVANRALPNELARRERAVAMTTLYAEARCQGVLLHTQHAVDSLANYLGQVVTDQRLLERTLSKLHVVYPTTAATPQLSARSSSAPMRVLVAGQTTDGKGMDTALEVLDRLAEENVKVEATLIAPLHGHGRARRAVVEELAPMDRRAFLTRLSDFDVLLMPTEGEGYGMLLVEAMAAGVVPVTSTGPNMRHARELVGGEPGAYVVEQRQSFIDQIDQYQRVLRSLADNRELREVSRSAAWRRVVHGALSVEKRDNKLHARYAAAARVTRELRDGRRRVRPTSPSEFSVAAVEWRAKLREARAGRSTRLFL